MTEQTNEQAADNVNALEAPTLEQLNESIQKLEKNRDEILTEKRIATEQRNQVQGELTAFKESSSVMTSKYQSLLKKNAFEDLLTRIDPTDAGREFMAYALKDSVELKTVDGEIIPVFTKDGKEIAINDLAKLVKEDSKYASHILARVGSGMGSTGGSSTFEQRKSTSSTVQNKGPYGLK
jgi:hypothetical protein